MEKERPTTTQPKRCLGCWNKSTGGSGNSDIGREKGGGFVQADMLSACAEYEDFKSLYSMEGVSK